jgi:hypothetical protein
MTRFIKQKCYLLLDECPVISAFLLQLETKIIKATSLNLNLNVINTKPKIGIGDL